MAMADDDRAKDVAAAGLGVLALALGAAAVLGVVRPPGGVVADGLVTRAVIGFVAGAIGLYIAGSRGWGRRIAVIGTAAALVGLALAGGAIAIDVLIDRSTG
jgi:hypothetical protein